MKEPFDDLVQHVLEGDATPEDRAQLEALIVADAALRRRRDELAHVFSLLGSARVAPAPEGLRDTVMQAIADLPTATDRHVPNAVSAFPARAGWTRMVLPVAAAIAAIALVWFVRTPSPASRGEVSGTMAGPSRTVSVRLGDGAAAVVVEGRAVETGIELQLRAGSAAGVAEIVSLDDGVLLSRPPQFVTVGAEPLSLEFEPGARILAHGRSTASEVPLRIVVRFADGRHATATLRVPARHARGPGG